MAVFWGKEQTFDEVELHCFKSIEARNAWVKEVEGLPSFAIGGRSGIVYDYEIEKWIGLVVHHLENGDIRYS